MKIALCQFHRKWEDKVYNLETAKRYIKEAKLQKCQLILFPEMSFTGFSMVIEKTCDKFDETIKEISSLASRFNISIGFGWVGMGKKKAQNHYGIINERGEMISDYVKIHPFSYSDENQYFESGEKLSVFPLHEFIVSTFICYDLRFPEIFQAVSKQAELIIVAANWPKKRGEHWKKLLVARAVENQSYIAAVNCVGEENGIFYSGDSCVINPDGKIMGKISGEEGLLMIELPKNTEKFRAEFPVKRDRKVEFYKKIL